MEQRLIDANALTNKLNVFNDRMHGNEHFLNGIESAKEIIENEPTIEAEPVRHGKWVLEQEKFDGYGFGNWNRWSCSCCGYVRTKGLAVTAEGHKPKAVLCENCGARMDEE